MNRFLRKIYHAVVPYKLRFIKSRSLEKVIQKLFQGRQQGLYEKKIVELKEKDKIIVAFFIATQAIWKLDELYRLMVQNERFEPIIVIYPLKSHSRNQIQNDLDKVEYFLLEKQYNYISTYNKKTNKWIDIKKVIKPDMIFFSQPYSHSFRKYNMEHYLDTSLICYVSYGFYIADDPQFYYNSFFNNLMWKGFYETPFQKLSFQKYADNKGVNIEVFGSPLFDEFIRKKEANQIKDVWKIKDRNKKRIIWAPHHSIKNKHLLSCFSLYAFYMLELAEKYKDTIQIAFKPHPYLKPKLYEHADWGITKTDAYYNTWRNLKNGQLEDGEYGDLFLTSDAMIFDSISFLCEYLYVGKPYLFTLRDKNSENDFNEFGKAALQKAYHASSREEIEVFLHDVVLEGKDSMRDERMGFFNTQILPSNIKSPSKSILNYLLEILEK